MKRVTGTAVSSKPISLSKAASTLSAFISAGNGASKAICSYLRRASASFNDLKQLHKDLSSSRSHRHPLEYGRTALPGELKAEEESSVAAIEKKKNNNKRRKKTSEDEDQRDAKSEMSANDGQIEAAEDLVEYNEKKREEEDANSGGAMEKQEMPVSDSKELSRKEKKRKNRDLEEEQQGTKRRKGNL